MAAAIGGGILLGLAGLTAEGWLLAWLGVIASAWALASEPSAPRAAIGLVIGGLLTRCCWFAWAPAMARAMLPGQPGSQALLAAGFVMIEALPVVASLAVLAVGFHAKPGWVRVWLPIGWVVGERVQARWTSVSSDWIFTQLELTPIMEAMHAWGLVPTTLLCLFAAASLGEGLALRSRGVAGLGLLACAPLVLAPALPETDPTLLVGLGAVHMSDGVHPPAVDLIDAELEVVVWPETSFNDQPPVQEGPVSSVRLQASAGGPRTHHLVGVETPARYGRQNMAVAVAPDGSITQARAKAVLLPIFERRFLGLGGEADFVPGHVAPVLDAGGRRFIALICGEILHRDLVAAGVDAGGEVLVVMARDRYQGGSTLADRHVLLKLRLRAIEYGVPAIYASMDGRASIVSARGEVLARSEAGARSGVLTWTPEAGGVDLRPDLDPPVTVLFDGRTPELRPDCAPGRCDYRPIEDSSCPDQPARTLVISGHGDGDRLAGLSPEQLAERVACFEPELIVLDACYSASAPILRALAQRSDALVVAIPAFLSARGFHYDAAFYDDRLPAEQRAAAVRTDPPSDLYVGRPDSSVIAEAEAWVAAADGDTLRPLVRSWVPTLVAVDIGAGQSLLVAADWQRIGQPPSP